MKTKKKVEASEDSIEKLIIDWLDLSGRLVAWKNDTHGTFDQKKGIYRSNDKVKGVSDILGFNNVGIFHAIEVKKPSEMKKVLNIYKKYECLLHKINFKHFKSYEHLFLKSHITIARQWTFILMIRRNGGVGFFASSIKEVLENLLKDKI